MKTRPDLQEVLRTNLRVLLALRKMTAGELAAHLDTDRTTVSKRMNGAREWALQDLAQLSEVFDVPIDALIGETSQLLGVVPPRMTGTDGVTRSVSKTYSAGNSAHVIQFPQAARLRAGYRVRNRGVRRHVGVTKAGWRRDPLNAAPVA